MAGAPAKAGPFELNSTSEIELHPDAIFGFGGRFTNGPLGDALFFQSDFNDDYIAGVGYQHFFYSFAQTGVSLGTEIGVAGRFGAAPGSAEIWGGGVVREAGVTLFDTLSISPSVAFGFSAVSGPNTIERVKEIAHNGDATLLLYLRPEFDFSTPSLPNSEFFWAVQHRSGANGTFGKLNEGSNAEIFGVRHRF